MSKRIYKVRITHTLYVLADSLRAAVDAAPGYVRDEGGKPDCDGALVASPAGLSDDVLESIPHGCGGYTKIREMTVAQAIEMGGGT